MAGLSPQEIADKTPGGVTPQVVRRYCASHPRQVGAKKRKGRWSLDPKKAIPWLTKHAPKLAARQTVAIAVAPAPDAKHATATPELEPGEPAIAQAKTADPSAPLHQQIGGQVAMLRDVVLGLTLLMRGGEISPQLSKIYREMNGELIRLVKLQREELETSRRVIDRTLHIHLVEALVRMDVQECDGLVRSAPETVLEKLAEAGIEFEDTKTARRMIQDAIRSEVEAMKQRKADAVGHSRRSIDGKT